MKKIFLMVMLLTLLLPVAHAADPDVIFYPRPISETDTRFDYHLSLLQEALERTVPEYGPFELCPASTVMNQLRQFELLRKGSSLIDISVKPTSIDREKTLNPVRIPLAKGLLGWRIMLINKNLQPALSSVETLDDLKPYTMGQGFGWGDVAILRYNNLKVVEGSDYEGLFRMLLANRFQLFPRGVGEALAEWEERHTDLPNLHVEEALLIHYPFARYFWTAKTKRGKALNERITKGLEMMIADGTFDVRFMEHYGDIIRRAKLNDRKLIRLENPDMPESAPLDRRELWFDPFAR